MAGTVLGGGALALLAGRPGLAWTLEGVVAVGLGALVLGRFCLGSYLYHLLRGETSFANRTLPVESCGVRARDAKMFPALPGRSVPGERCGT